MKKTNIGKTLNDIKSTPIEKNYKANLGHMINGFDDDVQFTDKDKKAVPSKSATILFGASVKSSIGLTLASSAILIAGAAGVASPLKWAFSTLGRQKK